MSYITVTQSEKTENKVTFVVEEVTYGNDVFGDCLDHTKNYTRSLFTGNAVEVLQYLAENGIEEVIRIGQ